MKNNHCFSINQEDPAHHNTICIPSNAWYSMLSTDDRREVSKWLGLEHQLAKGHDALKLIMELLHYNLAMLVYPIHQCYP